MSVDNESDRISLPIIQTTFQIDQCRLHVNSDDKYVQLIARSLGKKLIMRVNEDGVVTTLEGDIQEIMNASREFTKRLEQVTNYLGRHK